MTRVAAGLLLLFTVSCGGEDYTPLSKLKGKQMLLSLQTMLGPSFRLKYAETGRFLDKCPVLPPGYKATLDGVRFTVLYVGGTEGCTRSVLDGGCGGPERCAFSEGSFPARDKDNNFVIREELVYYQFYVNPPAESVLVLEDYSARVEMRVKSFFPRPPKIVSPGMPEEGKMITVELDPSRGPYTNVRILMYNLLDVGPEATVANSAPVGPDNRVQFTVPRSGRHSWYVFIRDPFQDKPMPVSKCEDNTFCQANSYIEGVLKLD